MVESNKKYELFSLYEMYFKTQGYWVEYRKGHYKKY